MNNFLGRAQLDERAAQLLGMQGDIITSVVIDKMLLLFAFTKINFKLLWRHLSLVEISTKCIDVSTYRANIQAANCERFALDLVKASLYEIERAHYGHGTSQSNSLEDFVDGVFPLVQNVFEQLDFEYQSKDEVWQSEIFSIFNKKSTQQLFSFYA